MIKVSITADSWHVGAEGLITMLVFCGETDRGRVQTEKEDEKPKHARQQKNSESAGEATTATTTVIDKNHRSEQFGDIYEEINIFFTIPLNFLTFSSELLLEC